MLIVHCNSMKIERWVCEIDSWFRHLQPHRQCTVCTIFRSIYVRCQQHERMFWKQKMRLISNTACTIWSNETYLLGYPIYFREFNGKKLLAFLTAQKGSPDPLGPPLGPTLHTSVSALVLLKSRFDITPIKPSLFVSGVTKTFLVEGALRWGTLSNFRGGANIKYRV